MNLEELSALLAQGEGVTVEFKRCGNAPAQDFFETVCSFANRQGGNIFLGVDDDGEIEGIPSKRALEIKRNIANVTHDSNLFSAAPLLEVEQVAVAADACVLRVWVPMGPLVYSFKSVVYDRVADADVRVKGVDQVAMLYLRKQNMFTERTVYSYVERSDLRDDLIDRAREMALKNTPRHPWGELTNDELLRHARLFTRNRQTGQEGYTLAAVLLLGTDEAIGDICPAYRTDAIVRIDNVDRYDSREIVATNLIDSYDRLVDFACRHTDDRFVLEGTQRVSARDIMVRELVANCLIHREYLSPFPAKLLIDKTGLKTENASRSLFEGRLSLTEFSPMPKNPTIADFFFAIGLAEEMGSGMRKLYRYSRLYSGTDPVMEEGDVFRSSVSLSPLPLASTTGAVVRALLQSEGYVTSAMIAAVADVTTRTAQRHIKTLMGEGVLVPDPTNSRRFIKGEGR